jgi:hypothetical protein
MGQMKIDENMNIKKIKKTHEKDQTVLISS